MANTNKVNKIAGIFHEAGLYGDRRLSDPEFLQKFSDLLDFDLEDTKKAAEKVNIEWGREWEDGI